MPPETNTGRSLEMASCGDPILITKDGKGNATAKKLRWRFLTSSLFDLLLNPPLWALVSPTHRRGYAEAVLIIRIHQRLKRVPKSFISMCNIILILITWKAGS